jgi:hypothetical protein
MRPSPVSGLLSGLNARLNGIGFERTRRAVAGLALSIFISLYLLVALNAPEGFAGAMVALAICYGVAFLAVVAEWFWGRWFATGLGWSGVMVAIASMVMVGWSPPLAIYGGLHAVVVITLMGAKMAARYDLQAAWRERYKMDEFGVARLKKTIIRSAASLPSLILWALGPKDGQGMVFAVAALALAATGLGAVAMLRTWGLFALAAAAVLVATTGDVVASNLLDAAGPTLAQVFLVGALIPFTLPIARYLLGRRSSVRSS